MLDIFLQAKLDASRSTEIRTFADISSSAVTTNDLKAAEALHNLRHELVWERAQIGDFFHATEEKQAIRDRVFKAILEHDFGIQATVCDKAKAQPRVRADKARFYKYPWFYHLNHR